MNNKIFLKDSEKTLTPVEKYGYLSINDDGLIYSESAKEVVQLKGLSFHGLGFGPEDPAVNPVGPKEFANRKAVINLAQMLKADIVRAPVYVDEWGGFFHTATGDDEKYSNQSVNRDNLYGRVAAIISGAVEAGLYVVIDWHILNVTIPDEAVGNSGAEAYHKTKYWQSKYSSYAPVDPDYPDIYEDTVHFFANMSRTYGDLPNVIFELANEPSKATLVESYEDWHNYVEPWAKEMIEVIRANDPDPDHPNLISVGTPTWSQYVGVAAESSIEDANVMYNAHIYAGSHLYPSGPNDKTLSEGERIRDEIIIARKAGKAVFISEWGSTTADGAATPDREQAMLWDEFFNHEGDANTPTMLLSSCYWNISSKDEASSIFNPDVVDPIGPWVSSNLSESGEIIRDILLNHTEED
nr:cellulase [Photobacterium panuliri]